MIAEKLRGLNPARTWRTLRHLPIRQLAWYTWRRGLRQPSATRQYNDGPVLVRSGAALAQEPIVTRMRASNADELCFLNVGRRFDANRWDWRALEMSRLWRYNLHYHDFLLDEDRPSEQVSALLTSWIQDNPVGDADGWEPYTVSLRIVNWVKLFMRAPRTCRVRDAWLASLHTQAGWLARNIEHHIGANHLLKNAKALLFAGVFFDGAVAVRWRRAGWKILTTQIAEQVLPDGGHYERSPMYHAIVLEDLLDLLNLVLAKPSMFTLGAVDWLQRAATRMLDFAHAITLPDGSFPLFNDAAYGISPPLDQLRAYAQRLFAYIAPEPGSGLRTVALEASGYYKIVRDRSAVIVDAGPPGPAQQPGHAHCDLLSYEWMVDGVPVVVDSGMDGYEQSSLRPALRQTAAHNTVRIDQTEQSEVWGTFRLGRRATPFDVRLQRLNDGAVCFSGAHDGYRYLRGCPIHRRSIEVELDDRLRVIDHIDGSGKHLIESFIHLHPRWHAEQGTADDGWPIVYLRDSRSPLAIQFNLDSASGLRPELEITTYPYCPAFGVVQWGSAIRVWVRSKLPLTFAYTAQLGSTSNQMR